MSRSLRVMTIAAVLAASLTVGVAPVLAAAAPSNDTYAGATVIAALPYDQTLDTSKATTDATDAQANADCGAPVTLASVWYQYTPTSDGAFLIDVSQSSYEAGVIVVSGSPGSFVLEACGPLTVAFAGTAGVSYHILAFSDTAGVNGGTLVLHMEAAPPPPELTLTVDPVGRFDPKTGTATLSGTWSCSGVADFAEIDGQLTQRVGRFTISGTFFLDIGPCDGSLQSWNAVVYPQNGSFAGGKGASMSFTSACGPAFCGSAFVDQNIQLKR